MSTNNILLAASYRACIIDVYAKDEKLIFRYLLMSVIEFLLVLQFAHRCSENNILLIIKFMFIIDKIDAENDQEPEKYFNESRITSKRRECF